MQIGDFVLIKDTETFSKAWPTASVIHTYPGPDGRVRMVDIRHKEKTYRRPICKLVLLLPEDHLPEGGGGCSGGRPEAGPEGADDVASHQPHPPLGGRLDENNDNLT